MHEALVSIGFSPVSDRYLRISSVRRTVNGFVSKTWVAAIGSVEL